MVESEDLQDECDEIVRYLNEQRLNVFYGEDLSEPGGIEFQWKGKNGWNDFIALAKKEEATTIIMDEQRLEKEDLDQIIEQLGEEGLKDQTISDDIGKLKKLAGKVAGIKLTWIKDGVKFSYHESSEWFDDAQELIATLPQPIRQLATSSTLRFQPRPMPKELRGASAEVIAQELLVFAEKEFPETDVRSLYSVSRLFWERKGLPGFGDPEAEVLKQKVEGIARSRLEEKQGKTEKEKIPQLVTAGIEWAKQYGFPKLTKQNLKAFLAEKEESLSKTSEDILLNQINFKLKNQ